ncbi:Rossmann-fold NAD(P)-binding domain-containing protein [Vibrio methylphosphonaticus]|uniref:cation transporter n=1 Tax=Vibrio methylphosphonaticus TaxID=2946866 RepID=UPI00202AA940|nr:cation transporter [Vibrio methylphosphonaticus]MCL9774896.1 cation transporter [Vibrio methylphosphonaticus]
MKRDCFGICLDRAVLSKNRASTFTHVRAYQKLNAQHEDVENDLLVSFSSPQMSGKEVLQAMKQAKNLVWRAGYFCPSQQ